MTTYYAVKDMYGNIWQDTLRMRRRDTMDEFMKISCDRWPDAYREGTRIVKVNIVEVTK